MVVLKYASCPMNGNRREVSKQKKLPKKRKFLLTNGSSCARISKLATRATVPCKLNNVRQTKHLGQL